MKRFSPICAVLILATSALANVVVTSPNSGAVMGSPVHYAATATTTTCSKGVASMGVYIDNQLTFVSNGTTLSTDLSFHPGTYNTVVEEWDYCGGATFTPIAITVTSQTGVWVSSPAPNSTVGSPVNYVASAATATCSKGVASMGVYVNNQLVHVSQGASLNTSITLSPGTYNNTVVEEWDYCGGASFTPVKVVVAGTTLPNLQSSEGWKGYGEFPPLYNICTSCGSGVIYSMARGVQAPSMTGNATQFNLAGNSAYADVLWTNPLIGDFSSQNLPDASHTLLPTLHNFSYEVYFFGPNLELSQSLEFDINQYFNGMSFIWGTQCRVAGGHEWDIWDNLNVKWVPSGVPCHPLSNAWNHATIQVQRTWDNWLLFQSITLNGTTTTLNRYYKPNSVPPGWYGVTINFQTDGNSVQAPYTVLLDKLNFTYW